MPTSSDAERNRREWDADSDRYQERNSAFIAQHDGLGWGVWHLPEAELQVLGEVGGRDVLELGCGAAQFGIGLARAGARVTGVDLSARQLAHARDAVRAAGVELALVEASAEDVPLPDGSFDVVFCDHGAMGFADPLVLIPEAARLLRPGGLVAWCWGTPTLEACWPVEEDHPRAELVRDVFGMHRFETAENVNFMLPHSATIAALTGAGLVVDALFELQPPPGATSPYRDATDRAWARRWPMEEIWRARKPR